MRPPVTKENLALPRRKARWPKESTGRGPRSLGKPYLVKGCVPCAVLQSAIGFPQSNPAYRHMLQQATTVELRRAVALACIFLFPVQPAVFKWLLHQDKLQRIDHGNPPCCLMHMIRVPELVLINLVLGN